MTAAGAAPPGGAAAGSKIVEAADRNELYAEPLHPYTQLLLSAAPDPWATPEDLGEGSLADVDAASAGEPPKVVDPGPGCRFLPRCPLAIQVCAELDPPLSDVRPDHRAACHVAVARSTDGAGGAGGTGGTGGTD